MHCSAELAIMQFFVHWMHQNQTAYPYLFFLSYTLYLNIRFRWFDGCWFFFSFWNGAKMLKSKHSSTYNIRYKKMKKKTMCLIFRKNIEKINKVCIFEFVSMQWLSFHNSNGLTLNAQQLMHRASLYNSFRIRQFASTYICEQTIQNLVTYDVYAK